VLLNAQVNALEAGGAASSAGQRADVDRQVPAAAVQVLFLCTHNSARSILAQAMLNHWAARLGHAVQAHSAGSAPGSAVHPLALAALSGIGVQTSGLRSKSWDQFAAAGAPPLDIVITVCDHAAAEACPLFVGRAGERPLKLHWGYPDPGLVMGDEVLRLQAFDLTRQALGYRVLQLLAVLRENLPDNERRAALQRIAGS
jgi:arsenate reductase